MNAHQIPWNDALSAGHAAIDAEHMELIRLFNELSDAVKQRKGKNVCGGILDAIIDHTVSHFTTEAELMKEYRYPKRAQHNIEHAQLIKQAQNYRAKFESAPPGTHIELIRFPEDWLTFHIATSDKELGGFLAIQESALR